MAYTRYARRPSTVGRTITNKYAGPCSKCGVQVAAGGGLAVSTASGWKVEHRPQRLIWDASAPSMGRRIDGCPEVDEGAAELSLATAEDSDGEDSTPFYGYNAYGRRRCEDAPCCGCC